jgi:hypothetical protein
VINQVKSKKLKVKIRGVLASYFAFLLLTFAFMLVQPAAAQDDPPDTAPPPLKIVSKDERQKLAAEDDIKDRTNLALQMMNIRLGTAEKHSANKDFDAMFRELGFFHGLVDDSVTFLEKRDAGNKKVLDTFKKLEMGLRGFIPRLETVRRELPLRYEDYVRHLMKFVREARARAIDPMFSDNVVKTKTEI